MASFSVAEAFFPAVFPTSPRDRRWFIPRVPAYSKFKLLTLCWLAYGSSAPATQSRALHAWRSHVAPVLQSQEDRIDDALVFGISHGQQFISELAGAAAAFFMRFAARFVPPGAQVEMESPPPLTGSLRNPPYR